MDMTRRKFIREFKVDAVRLVTNRGVAVAQAARVFEDFKYFYNPRGRHSKLGDRSAVEFEARAVPA